MKFVQTSQILGLALAASSLCPATPLNISNRLQPSESPAEQPAVPISEWEVGSSALYARSVDDSETCPKGTGFDCVDAVVGVCCSRGKRLCGGMCVTGECCGALGGCSRDERCWLGRCYPRERFEGGGGAVVSSGAGALPLPPVTMGAGAGAGEMGESPERRGGRRRDSAFGFVVLVAVWIIDEVWGDP
ncbi:hypothetical protein CORC01_01674 [Colletotrichum orchidophilum]|uniref:Uncharacterized protein n=1 Tax=Colletotrichum orchidophilum TaxID=1209926 RepID=A0A1G4BNP7_9PEZI|nr:uncharacterized protein CORC01_01674 [Colletotrichum orchidophilum]OHF02916.1 hypothetical protein CORC01_01674 [Colletotrichum orchidophilum]